MNVVIRTTIALLLLSVAVAPAVAQVTTATFYGTVTDSSQAVLPGASISMTHEGTAVVTTKVSDEKGEFAFTFLPPGAYTLKIELPGFKTYVNSGFELGAAQSVRRSFSLEVGGVAEQVTVTSEAPLVNTVASDQRLSYSKLQITELPLANRDFTGLLASNTGMSYSGTNIRMNGMGGAGTRITVDGTEATAFSEGSGTSMFGNFNKIGLVGLDAIGEIQTTKGIIAAEYAGTLSGNVNVITKAGTNEWHGSMFENYTGAALNAQSDSDYKASLHFQSIRGFDRRPHFQKQNVHLWRLRRLPPGWSGHIAGHGSHSAAAKRDDRGCAGIPDLSRLCLPASEPALQSKRQCRPFRRTEAAPLRGESRGRQGGYAAVWK